MPAKRDLLQALKSKIRVGMNPDMCPERRHGSLWFDVNGVGRQRRDFTVNLPEHLLLSPKRFARAVAQQIMLVDPTLPKSEEVCRPAMIDIVVGGRRRMYDMDTMALKLEE